MYSGAVVCCWVLRRNRGDIADEEDACEVSIGSDVGVIVESLLRGCLLGIVLSACRDLVKVLRLEDADDGVVGCWVGWSDVSIGIVVICSEFEVSSDVSCIGCRFGYNSFCHGCI